MSSLSTRTKFYMKSALADRTAALELIAAVDAATPTPAASQAAVSPSTVVAITVPDNLQASINTALASAVAAIQANRTAINGIISKLKAAGLMS